MSCGYYYELQNAYDLLDKYINGSDHTKNTMNHPFYNDPDIFQGGVKLFNKIKESGIDREIVLNCGKYTDKYGRTSDLDNSGKFRLHDIYWDFQNYATQNKDQISGMIKYLNNNGYNFQFKSLSKGRSSRNYNRHVTRKSPRKSKLRSRGKSTRRVTRKSPTRKCKSRSTKKSQHKSRRRSTRKR